MLFHPLGFRASSSPRWTMRRMDKKDEEISQHRKTISLRAFRPSSSRSLASTSTRSLVVFESKLRNESLVPIRSYVFNIFRLRNCFLCCLLKGGKFSYRLVRQTVGASLGRSFGMRKERKKKASNEDIARRKHLAEAKECQSETKEKK
jgi:hypothetical protein